MISTNQDIQGHMDIFDADFYRTCYKDMSTLSPDECKHHFVNHGYYEYRYVSNEHKRLVFSTTDMDVWFYRSFYPDLSGLTQIEARNHWHFHGRSEGRIACPPFQISNVNPDTTRSACNVKTDDTQRVLVIYVFHVFNDRVKTFINCGIFSDPNTDFLMICNDPTIDLGKLSLPEHVKSVKRENIGFDFGAHSYGLLTNDLYKDYDKYVLLNSSCMGPYIPSYFTGKWTDIFLQGLKGNVKLFGSMINTERNPVHLAHVQSNIFALDKETLEYLIEKDIFNTTHPCKDLVESVNKEEIGMSRAVIENGWNIGCLFPGFQDIDFTFKDKSPHDYGSRSKYLFEGDLMYPRFRYTLWDPFQLVFYKGNRF